MIIIASISSCWNNPYLSNALNISTFFSKNYSLELVIEWGKLCWKHRNHLFTLCKSNIVPGSDEHVAFETEAAF